MIHVSVHGPHKDIDRDDTVYYSPFNIVNKLVIHYSVIEAVNCNAMKKKTKKGTNTNEYKVTV